MYVYIYSLQVQQLTKRFIVTFKKKIHLTIYKNYLYNLVLSCFREIIHI